MNIKLLIEYDGSDFCGWQRQFNGPSIQAALESVLEKTLKCRTPVFGAGRTDSGVHAQGQVATFKTDRPIEPARWVSIFNDHLPRSIRVLQSQCVPDSFHPQKDATGKLYEYCILNRPFASALNRRVYLVPRPLNWDRIRQALPDFEGRHDFAAFQGAKADVQSTVRVVRSVKLFDRGDGLFALRIEGNGFLKQMVRTMVGTLVEIGLGKRNVGDIKKILASRDRQQAGHTAPASGLTLVRVFYPGDG